MKPLTATEIIAQLVRERWLAAFCLPTYAPKGWWECDVFEVTKAGYWHEFEVKLSRADFLADARKKQRDRWKYVGGEKVDLPGPVKHELLAAKSTKGPSRFTFVVPAGLIPLADVPEWAGLFEAERVGSARVAIRCVKTAPRLHTEKFGDGRLRDAEGTSYYRFHRATVAYATSEVGGDGEGI